MKTNHASTRASGKQARPVCYSSSLKYVFIHIPKCAGSSIHVALRKLHERASLPIDPRRYHKHAKAVDVRRVLGKTWIDCFKFSFVRNPWDLMVSSYHWWLEYAGQFHALAEQAAAVRSLGSFERFVGSPSGSDMLNEQHGRDLLDWLEDDTDIIVDFVGRYENLDPDWRHICEALKVDVVPLTRENRVERADYRSFYNDRSRAVVADRFARTIAHFGYEF